MTPERKHDDQVDIELVHAVARGEEPAFISLYDRYSSILLGLLLRILHSRPESEDVLQEVFLQVWQQARSFDAARGRPFTWLVTLARSRAIDRLRLLESRNRTALRSTQEVPESIQVGVDEVAIRSEQSELVRGALDELPEEQRRTLVLAYLEGLSQSEIATRLGQPLGTVKTRTRAGLLKLHGILRERVKGG
ncbi:MAG: sigma-70 family RNA polymerase sigma factor [Acidobacteria bacterium]|nr:sigma-70 family RNA polymerase sigma factor [Acidobacteriota bacterium]